MSILLPPVRELERSKKRLGNESQFTKTLENLGARPAMLPCPIQSERFNRDGRAYRGNRSGGVGHWFS